MVDFYLLAVLTRFRKPLQRPCEAMNKGARDRWKDRTALGTESSHRMLTIVCGNRLRQGGEGMFPHRCILGGLEIVEIDSVGLLEAKRSTNSTRDQEDN